jgi:hypothetical protein
MPAVLTTASVLLCPHLAPLVIRASQRLLTVDGQPVLLRADILAASVPTCTNTGGPRKPCTAVTVTAGVSRTLSVGGEPVVLANASGFTDAAPGPVSWRVSSVNQTKLEAACCPDRRTRSAAACAWTTAIWCSTAAASPRSTGSRTSPRRSRCGC